MAIKAISQFPSGIPADNDYILFEQNGEGKSATIGDAVNTCTLTYEEIMASTADLSGMVASAEALKTLNDSSYCEHVVTENSGEYWRFASGLQICTLYKSFGSPTFVSWGSIYNYYLPSIDFPAPFVSAPYVTTATTTIGAWAGMSGDAYPNTTSWNGIAIFRPTTSSYALNVRLIAIGRWK